MTPLELRRELANASTGEIARLANVSRRTVERARTGAGMHMATFERLVRALAGRKSPPKVQA